MVISCMILGFWDKTFAKVSVPPLETYILHGVFSI